MVSYFIFYVGVSAWIYFDSKKRNFKGIPYAIVSLFFGMFSLPVYLAKRNLKEGEVREGGLAWNILKNFALFYTILVAFIFIAGIISADIHPANDEEKAAAGLAVVLGGAFFILIWIVPTVCALVLGALLKKSSIIEKGPTGERIEKDANIFELPGFQQKNVSVSHQIPPPPPNCFSSPNVYLLRNNEQHGPYSLEDLRGWLKDGVVGREDLVWHEGMQGWEALNSVLK